MLTYDMDESYVAQVKNENAKSANHVKFYRHFYEKAKEFRDYILIICPGNAKSEVRRPVQDIDKMVYPEQWSMYLQGKEMQINGTPIESLGLDKSISDSLKTMYVYTIEQAAQLSDLALQKVMGGHDIRNKAKAFLDKNNTEVVELKALLEEERARAAAEREALQREAAADKEQLQKQITDMQESINELLKRKK